MPMRSSGEPTQALPEDPEVLRALLLAAWAERDAAAAAWDALAAERDSVAAERDSVAAERDALAERTERLQHLLQKLRRMQFGPRSERLPEDQLRFAFEEVEASLASNEAETEKRSPEQRRKNTARRRAGRGRLPAHLPRIGACQRSCRAVLVTGSPILCVVDGTACRPAVGLPRRAAAAKVRCSPASPCSLRCAWLRVAARLPSPSLRAMAARAPGRDGKAGPPVEPESRASVAVATTLSRSGLRVTAPIGVQSRVRPLHRRGLASRARW
jgi:hypothetical protein